MPDGTRPKGARETRNERLEAQLRANLKRRKDQTRSRAREPHDGEIDAASNADHATAGSQERGAKD